MYKTQIYCIRKIAKDLKCPLFMGSKYHSKMVIYFILFEISLGYYYRYVLH